MEDDAWAYSKHHTIAKALGEDFTDQELATQHAESTRQHTVAMVLYSLRQYAEALERLSDAVSMATRTSETNIHQTMEFLERLLVCFVKTGRKRDAKAIIAQAVELKGLSHEADLWHILSCKNCARPHRSGWGMSACMRYWETVQEVVAILELKQYNITQETLVSMAMNDDDEMKIITITKRSELFGLSETLLLTLLERALKRKDIRIRTLLLKQNVERILRFIVEVQCGAGAIMRTLLGNVEPNTVDEQELTMLLNCWTENINTLQLFSEEFENEVLVPTELRIAAAGNIHTAVELLMNELQAARGVQTTERMLKIAAARGTVRMVKRLLQRRPATDCIPFPVITSTVRNDGFMGDEIEKLFQDYNATRLFRTAEYEEYDDDSEGYEISHGKILSDPYGLYE